MKENISIKYHDGIIHKSPRLDHIEGYYIKYGKYDEAISLIIADNTVDFNELTSSLICQREEIQRNVVSGLIQNEDIETITYDADNRIYTVALNENINREYLAIELLFNLNQWGNTIAYKSVDTEGNDIDNTDYSFNLPKSRINASLFDEGISYLIMAIPNENYVPFSIKVYDPYDENNYRYINVVLKQTVIPEPVPEPVPLPAPETVQNQEPTEVSVKPVVNTCAK